MKRNPSLNNCKHGVIDATCTVCWPKGNIVASHTPGPWQKSELAPLYVIQDGDSNPICSLGEYTEDGRIDRIFHNAEANARLIAAAPDLLTQLKALVVQIEHSGHLIVPPNVKAAIAKAEGKVRE